MGKKNSVNQIVKMLRGYKNESVIIYCFSRKDCENIAAYLKKEGFSARPYHAGLRPEIRKHTQELFIKDEVNIIVATIAFGMGIDKPDVRLVIHHTFPKTLEGYYQEIGRAGRDGLPSDCVLFYSLGDKRKHEYFIDKIEDTAVKLGAKNKLHKVISYCESDSCRRKYLLGYFNEIFPLDNCKGCDVCLDLPGRAYEDEEYSELEEEKVAKKPKFHQIKLNYDGPLFEKLRELRKEIASEKKVPPFIIFGDVSLIAMATELPQNKDDFLRIKGVGQQKLRDYGGRFIEKIKEHVEEHLSNEITKNSFLKKLLEKDYIEKVEKLKENPLNAYEPWSEAEENTLKKMYSEKKHIDEIAEVLARQPGAIRSRLRKLGLILG